MISVSSIQCKPENAGVKAFLTEVRHASRESLHQRLLRGQRDGDLPPDADIAQMTEFYFALQQSLSYEARDGGTRAAAQKIIDMAMRAMPARESEPA